MLSTLSRISEGSEGRGVPNWLSTHPAASDRVERVGSTLSELAVRMDITGLRVNRQGYLDRLDGLIYGDNPDQGVVRGRDFLHTDLRFALRFPDGWEVVNTETQVGATQPGEEVSMVLQLVRDPGTRDLAALAVDNMRRGGYRLDAGGETSINGLDAFVGTFTGGRDGNPQRRARIAYIDHRRSVYALGGLAEAYDRVEAEFNEAIRSFRPLSAAEAEEIRPNRIRFYTVHAGDTWQSIAQDAGQGIVVSNTLAILNGFPVTSSLEPVTVSRLWSRGEGGETGGGRRQEEAGGLRQLREVLFVGPQPVSNLRRAAVSITGKRRSPQVSPDSCLCLL